MKTERRSWLQKMISSGKIRPNYVPKDIFFQFKKHQPYNISSSLERKNTYLDCDSKIQSIYHSQKKNSHEKIQCFRKKNNKSSLDFLDKKAKEKKIQNFETNIQKQKKKIINDIGNL